LRPRWLALLGILALAPGGSPVELAGVARAGERHHDGAGRDDAEHRSHPRRPGSIYELDVTLTDETGARAGLDLFRGHPVLISMFYASCSDACPLLVADLRRLESRVPRSARADLRVILVSLDPERDTPEVLRGLARLHGVDAVRWRFLTADDDVVREIAAALGIKFRRVAGGTVNHTSVIALLDRTGAVDTRLEGLGQPTARLVERLMALAPRPTR
jgi:protein SCO1/2